MKIAFVNMPWSPTVLPLPTVDSIGSWIAAAAQRLATDHQVLIYSRQTRADKPVQNYGNIQFRRKRLGWDDLFNITVRPIQSKVQGRASLISKYHYRSYIRQVAQDLRQQQCDVVHVPCFPHFISAIRRVNPSLKIVLHCHEEWLVQLDRAQVEPHIQQADLILGCSQYLVNRFRAHFPEYAERFQVMYNGVDLEAFDTAQVIATNKPKQLLFVGRVSPEKGVHVLLEAFAQVIEQYPQVELKIVGYDEPLLREYLQAINEDPKIQDLVRFCTAHYGTTLRKGLSRPVAERVQWVGGVLHAKVIDYLHQADIVINPSFYESFGNSIIEAMAAGVPVVASAVGGMNDTVVANETGLLVESGNVDQLTAAILTLLRDESKCQMMGQAGRQRLAQQFTWDKIVVDLSQQYERVVAQ